MAATQLGDIRVMNSIMQNPNFHYHSQNKTKKCKNPKTSYATYLLKAARHVPQQEQEIPPEKTPKEKPKEEPGRSKMRTCSQSSLNVDKAPAKKKAKLDNPCIKCN